MEFSSSSSSDAELEEELHRNFHREQREQRGIVRASSSPNSYQTMSFPMPDGRSIEVRKGSIYIPLRDMYVHVLQARRCPERWFGDGRVPLRRRRPLPADVVVLQRVTEAAAAGRGGSTPRPLVSVTLREATDNDFFIFKEVRSRKAEGDAGEVAAPIIRIAPFTPQKRQNSWHDPLTDTRFQRMTFLSRWHFSMAYPRLLREYRYDTWDAIELSPPLHMEDVCCYDDLLGILWCLSGRDGRLCYLRYDNNAVTTTRSTALTSVCVTTVDVTTAQRCVGIYCKHEGSPSYDAAGGDYQEANSCVCCLLVVTASHALCVRLVYTWGNKFTVDHVLSTLKVESVLSKPLQLANVTCCCPGNAEKPPGVPLSSSTNDMSFCVGAGRSVFAFIWRNGQWRRVRLASFVVTDVTALTLHAAFGHSSLPVAVVAGMRNGTIQVVTAEGRLHNKVIFDPTPRHCGSDITSMYAVPGLAYGVVSVARDGGAKLWDLRRLGSDKNPVCTLLTSRLGGGQSGVGSTAMAGHLLAVSSVSTGLVCVDAQTGTQLLHTTKKLSPATRIAFGSLSNVDDNDGFELYTFSPHYTQRFHLHL
ncbi:conserved hypothetical protein [Leishmania braziliensis MHOM/BR/75/M2904]|uniref:Uncharacterized protein n=2 Tax=Leishmania braziliensis TaxID=5660 RepID=A4HF13_LEIBR|nr:conserved hypothetical protein [Leishmania braziliensis MHOM/BR/75/M2904]CAJ2474772.1 unnamed protein product [Leishmania braziliensis]CAM39422.2 conserved hypothetical protein [Leishmania braziliensis MHOM/BR/75/M2904]SYZ66822.1 hypothetical_protein [Leishmania braziliensis MHOM/BR/75/M2904]